MKTSAKRKIYIEATALSRTKRTGVDYYAEGLIAPLVAQNPDIDFVFFRFAEDGDDLRITGKNVREVVITKIPARIYRLLLTLGIAPTVEWLTGEEAIDEVIFPNFYAWPIATKHSRIFPIVPDTAFADLPQYVEHVYHRQLLHRGVRRSVQVAEQVFTCSKSSAKSIQNHFGISAEHITVLYPGYTPAKPVKTSKSVVKGDYMLFVSTLEPRKNVANLIRAYMQLPVKIRAKYQLVLAGGKGWLDSEIQELITQYQDQGVVALGYVDEAQKESLYAHASLFVYPALYEGFGMPIVEAQAHGLPIITCRNTSLPEAAGSAAVYSEGDPKSIAGAIQELLADPAKQKQLIRAGRKNASQFTWKRSVAALQKVLDNGKL